MTIARPSPLGDVLWLREAVEAKFANGVLELVLPKAESVKPRMIKINATSK